MSFYALPFLVLVTIVSIPEAQTKSVKNCPLGHFVSGDTCRKCPPGTYQELAETKVTKCTPCPNNTYTPFHGVVSSTLCIPCPLDETSTKGSVRCTKCPKGEVGACGKCMRCPAGTIIDTSQCKCDPCTDKSYVSTEANKDGCTDCPWGFRANGDHSKCVIAKCKDGFNWNGYECIPCVYNRFRSGSMLLCEECPWGTYTNNLHGPNTECNKCEPGEYVTDLLPQTSMSKDIPKCKKCPEKSTTVGFSKPFCRKKGESCPPNTFEDAEGDCNLCDVNHRVDTKKKKCVPCEENSASPRGVRTKCVACLPGEMPDSYGLCTCSDRYSRQDGVCSLCPAGTYGLHGYCRPCEKGFVSKEGSDACTSCPEGTTTFDGRNKCEPIPSCQIGFIAGLLVQYFHNYWEETCISGTTGCPSIDHRVKKIGRRLFCVNQKGKVVCPPDQVFNGKNKCINCLEGEVLSMRKGKLVCKRCPTGSTSSSKVARKCTSCGEGYLKELGFRAKCVCDSGRFVNDKGNCERCPEGFVYNSSDRNTCIKCENGFTPMNQGSYCGCANPKVVNSEGKCISA